MHDFNAIIIGAGAAGSIAAIEMARRGLDVLVVDKVSHPRHQLGESFMPRALQILREMDIEQDFRRLPHVHKVSGQFQLGHESEHFIAQFNRAWPIGEREAFNVERAPFDAMLCNKAREAGATVMTDTKLTRIVSMQDGYVEIETKGGNFSAQWLVDCSGPATVIGKHLGIRKPVDGQTRVAYYTIAKHVQRPEPPNQGAVVGIMHDDGWFWAIPLDEERTSIGVVLDRDVNKRLGIDAKHMLKAAINRSPEMKKRCANAEIPETNQCVANFSYSCGRWSGPGFFLVGDAGAFIDPIFSTGVTIGMECGRDVARHVAELIEGKVNPDEVRGIYEQRMKKVTGIFFGLVDAYYKHPFRELFLSGKNPFNVRKALLTLLAGHAFDAPRYLTWRLKLLQLFIWLNTYIPIVRRRTCHTLFD